MFKKQNSLMKFSRSERLAQLSEQECVIERKKREIQAKIEAMRKKETDEAIKILLSSRGKKINKPDVSDKSSTKNRDESKKEKEKEDSEKEEKQKFITNLFSNDGSFLDHYKKMAKDAGWDYETVPYDERKKPYVSDKESKNTKKPYSEKKFSDPNIQVPLPPPGVAQLFPQQRNSLMMPSTSQQNPVSGIQCPPHLMQSSSINSGPSFKREEDESRVVPTWHDPEELTKSSLNQSSSSELSSTQPPKPMKPQNIPHSLPSRETGKTSVPLLKSKLKEFETDSSSEDESDYGKRFKRKQFRSFTSGDSSKQGSTSGSSVRYDSTSLPHSTSRKEYSGVSPALYEDDGDDEDEDGAMNEAHHQMAELVARWGDDFEDSLRDGKKDDLAVRLLSDKTSKQYLCYRKLVHKYRRNAKLNDKSEDSKLSTDKSNSDEDKNELSKKTLSESCSEHQLAKQDSRDGGNAKKDSLDENASDKPRESKSRFDQKLSDSYQKTNEDLPYYKMPEGTSKEEGFSFVQKQNSQEGLEKETESSKAITKEENGEETKTEERRKRKRKSRWGDAVPSSSSTPVIGPGLSLQPPGVLPAPKTNLLSQLTRSDPGLIQYARQTFGSTNLSEEDWKKAEDHYKINLLYQNMVRKRAEIDKLEKAGKFKYEYDSDEDVEGGTWEHKLRQQEMMATQMWAEELTRQAAGKHHIGDFLPPEELERFMEKYNAVKEGREPDLSDYKEFKLKEDNVGYRLLQKMGWDEGQGLGQDGSGIKNPVNKATTRHENQGLGIERPDGLEPGDDEYDAYRKRMMLAYRFRPNPLNNPRRPYY